MSNLPVKVSRDTLSDLASLFVSPDIRTGTTAELVITMQDERINAREFGAYLRMMDRIYGRVSKGGLKSYSLTPYRQLKIAEIRRGSTELVILEIFSHFQDSLPFVVLWLFLKYIPIGFKVISEATKNFADSYKTIQEGRLVSQNRKKLKEEMKRDAYLQKLSNTQINQLIALLASLEADEYRALPAATRFAQKYVKSVTISVRETEEEPPPRS